MTTPTSDKPLIESNLMLAMQEIYGARDWQTLNDFITQHTHVFFDTEHWSNSLQQYDGCFGTRLHATIMALNSGIPAILVHHDSRTREICEFAALPSISADAARLSGRYIDRALKAADFEAYKKTRERNYEKYRDFLLSNDLKPTPSGARQI